MRRAAILISGLFLGACNTTSPNDGAAYFDNITPDPTALAAEETRLAAAETGRVNVQPPANVETQPTATLPPSGSQAAATTQPPVTNQTVQTATATQPISTGGISNTQDFGAIKQQESIQSDAAKLAALRGQYQEVAPEALPERSDQTNLAAYALSQPHAVGTRKFRRFNIGIANCSRFRSDPDGAQRLFLQSGGPQKDPKRLDPDGDGFACGWDPETYRRLLRATQNG